jgi:hypothetical protein
LILTKQNLPNIPPGSSVLERDFVNFINPKDVKAVLDEINRDIQGIYQAIDKISSAARRQELLEEALIEKINERALLFEKELADAVENLKQEKAPNTYPVNLRSLADYEFNSSLYKKTRAYIDLVKETICPKLVESKSYTKTVATVIKEQFGSVTDPTVQPGAAITLPWSVEVHARRPLKSPSSDLWEQVKDGAATWLSFDLKRPVIINNLSIAPTGALPLSLVTILVYKNDDPEEQPLVLYNKPETVLYEKFDYSFPDLVAKRVEILINQRHFIRQESATLKKVWYKYEYGIEKVAFNHNLYSFNSEWISKPISPGGVIGAVRLVSEEYKLLLPHYQQEDFPMCSVEYDIMAGEDGEWLPILPEGNASVTHELLKFEQEGSFWIAGLRFASEGDVRVYNNGFSLKPGQDFQVFSSQRIKIGRLLPGVYTASYRPKPFAYQVEPVTKGRLQEVTEKFFGTVDNTVKLRNTPYIDWQKVNKAPSNWDVSDPEGYYCPVLVSIINKQGTRITQPTGIINATDYRLEKPQVPNNNELFTYNVKDRILTFNNPVGQDEVVAVTYTTAPEVVRLRVTLRRHSEEHIGLAPIVSNLGLRLEMVAV